MSTIAATRSKTYDIVYIAVFAVIMAICSWISIPTAVPFTLQTFGVFVAVGVLGGKKRNTFHIGIYSAWSNWSTGICRIFWRYWCSCWNNWRIYYWFSVFCPCYVGNGKNSRVRNP